MAQSALRALTQQLMQGGPAPAGMASAQTAIQNAAQRPQPKPMGQQVADVLGGVALPLSTVPVVGDIAGLGADAAMYANYPEERTALNYGLTLAGILPFVPGAAGIRTAGQAAEGALDMSQAARIQRASEQGFDVDNMVRLAGRDIPVRLNPLDQKRGMEMVEVNTPAFEDAFRKNDSFYVGPQGAGGIAGRYERFSEYQRNADYIDVPSASVSPTGEIMFGDGRHRYAYMRDQGLPSIPMAMDAESLTNAQRFGYLAQGREADALDMSQAARMQRAREQGFDERVFYHGGASDFDEFVSGRRGNYFTNNPDIANIYAMNAEKRWPDQNNASPNVLPVRLRGPALVVSDQKNGSGGWYKENLQEALGIDLAQIPVSKKAQALREEAQRQGYGFLEITDMDDLGGRQSQFISLDPSNIRSVNAAFDPAKRNSANLMAGVMGGAVGLSALRQLMPQQEQE